MHNEYTYEETRLAHEIAKTLNDMHSLQTHLQFVKKYKHEFLQAMLTHVMSIPDEKIINNRAALYMSIIKNNGRYGNLRD